MTPQPTLDQLLDSIELLLESQRTLVLEGVADSLPVLSTSLSQALGQVLAYAGTPQMAAQRQRVEAIQKQAMTVGTMLHRRQSDVRRSLDALGSSHGSLSEMQTQRVYAPAGLLLSSLSSRAMGSA
ncbi:MAG: hypothetical protein V4738_00640 [Pseudomonadota bacterium]